MLHPAIVVKRSSINGVGLFADQAINRGEVIWRADPNQPRFHIDDIMGWPKDQRAAFLEHAWQVADYWYEGRKDGSVVDSALYMNHSCDPNTWFDGDKTMSSRRAIESGAEITYDYVMSEVKLPCIILVPCCKCGSEHCRKVVKSTDYLEIAAVQDRYREHVMPHVIDMLRAQGRKTARVGC